MSKDYINIPKNTRRAIGGIALSSLLFLSGCGNSNTDVIADTQSGDIEPTVTASAVIMENGNAMIVDLDSYQGYSEERGPVSTKTEGGDKTWILFTTTGDKLFVDYDSIEIIEGEHAHEKAEIIANALVGANGQVTYYDEIQPSIKTR